MVASPLAPGPGGGALFDRPHRLGPGTCLVAMGPPARKLLRGVALAGVLAGMNWASVAEAAPFLLAAEDAWTEDERAWLEELAERLPPATTHLRRPPLLRRVAAPTLPDDLRTPHVVARPRGGARTIELGLDGLDDAVEAWRGGHPDEPREPGLTWRLLERQLAHALVHRLDRVHQWSAGNDWQALSAWGAWPWRKRAGEHALGAFASPHGMASAREDLATMGELVLVPAVLPGDRSVHPRCTSPSKWRLLEAHLGARAPVAGEACAPLAEVGLDPEQVLDIEVVYVEATADHTASIGGHVLVSLRFAPDHLGTERREVYGLVADTGELEGGAAYVFRGLSGGFPSRVAWEPFSLVAIRYATFEDRDVRVSRMVLTEEEQRRALARLDELRHGWHRPYSFFTRNCGELPRELAEVALGRDLGLPALMGPDTLVGRMERVGLLEPVPLEDTSTVSLSRRVQVARELQEQAFSRLIMALPHRKEMLARARRDLDRGDARRIEAYGRIEALAQELGPQDAQVYADLDRVLAWADALEVREHRRRARQGRRLERASIEALRRSKVELRVQAAEDGVSVARLANPQEELAGAALQQEHHGTTHSPLGAMRMDTTWRQEGAMGRPWLALRSQLYENNMGEARRHPVATGIEMSVLVGELRLSLDAAEARSTTRLLGLKRVLGERAVLNPGFYGRFVEVDNVWGSALSLGVDWAEAGGVLELLQADGHRHHLHATVGLVGSSAWGAGEVGTWLPGTTIGMPMGLQGRLASRHQATTALDLRARYQPTWAAQGARFQELRAEGAASVYLREVFAASVALRLQGALGQRWQGAEVFGSPWFEAGLGLWVEPY